jgi:hypothetical protein
MDDGKHIALPFVLDRRGIEFSGCSKTVDQRTVAQRPDEYYGRARAAFGLDSADCEICTDRMSPARAFAAIPTTGASIPEIQISGI